MKRPSFLTIVGVLSSLFIFGLAGSRLWAILEAKQRPVDMTVAVSSWASGRLLHSAESLGYFARRGIRVAVVDVGDDYNRASREVLAGTADGAALVLSEPLLLSAGGLPMHVMLNLDTSAGAMGIVASDDISTLAELKGKRVAYEPDSFEAFLLDDALSRSGLSENDIISIPKNAIDAGRAFLLREVDAVVTFEPFLRQASSRKDSRVLFTSKEAPGLLPHVAAFRQDYAENHAAELRAFASAWFDMVNDLEHDPERRKEILAIVAIKGGTSLADIERQFAGIRLFSFAENAAAFTYDEATTSLYGSGRRFLTYFERQGKLQRPVDLFTIIDPTILRNVER